MPFFFGLISIKYRTPIMSVILAVGIICNFWYTIIHNLYNISHLNTLKTVLALIFILIRDMDTLLNISMLLVYIFNQLTVLALIYMRKTRPNDPRPFKVIGYKIILSA